MAAIRSLVERHNIIHHAGPSVVAATPQQQNTEEAAEQQQNTEEATAPQQSTSRQKEHTTEEVTARQQNTEEATTPQQSSRQTEQEMDADQAVKFFKMFIYF